MTLAADLVRQFGSDDDYRFSSAISLKKATTLTTTFGTVLRYDPWNDDAIKDHLKYHPVALWSNLKVTIAPRAGVYGRMCTLFGGWGAEGMTAPTTIGEMVTLNNAVNLTYGGTGDPGTIAKEVPCTFSSAMQAIIKTPYASEVRPVFYYCFIETPIVDKLQDADRFTLIFSGQYTVHGRY